MAPQRRETQRRLYRYFDTRDGGRTRGPAAPAGANSDNPWPRPHAILRGAPPILEDATAEEEGEYEDEDDGYMGV